MAAAGDGSGHTPLTPEWTPAPSASHYPWQGDRPAAAPSFVCALRYRLACKMWALGAPLPPLARGGVDHGLALVGHPTKFCSSVQNYFCLKIAGDSKVEMFLRYVNTFGPGYTGWNRPLNRVGIVGGGVEPPPTVHVYTRSF